MPRDQEPMLTELEKIALCLSSFDSIREDMQELFEGLGAIKDLVDGECIHLERADREDEIAYAKWRGYSAMRLHVASVCDLRQRLDKAMERLLAASPALASAKAAFDRSHG